MLELSSGKNLYGRCRQWLFRHRIGRFIAAGGLAGAAAAVVLALAEAQVDAGGLDGVLGVLLAYLPLVALAVYFRAGALEEQGNA